MKKTIIFVIIAVVLLLLIISPYIIDDVACFMYKNEIENRVLDSDNITLLEINNKCGNASGTGNHTDMYVCALIQTPISPEQLECEFGDAINIFKIENEKLSTNAMNSLGIEFEDAVLSYSESYYIIEFIDRAPCSDFDIRGH